MKYETLDRLFRNRRSGYSYKKLCNNTYLTKSFYGHEECLCVKLHGTVIFKVFRDNSVSLEGVSWYSYPTTRDRLRRYLPSYISVYKFLNSYKARIESADGYKKLPVAEGIKYSSIGSGYFGPLNHEEDTDLLEKEIDRYSKWLARKVTSCMLQTKGPSPLEDETYDNIKSLVQTKAPSVELVLSALSSYPSGWVDTARFDKKDGWLLSDRKPADEKCAEWLEFRLKQTNRTTDRKETTGRITVLLQRYIRNKLWFDGVPK